MANTSEVQIDSHAAKEEGEITDDDEVEVLFAEEAPLRHRDGKRHSYGYDSRTPRKYDSCYETSGSSSRQRDDSPADRYRSRESSSSRHRVPYPESTRSSLSANRQEPPYHSQSYGKTEKSSSRDRYAYGHRDQQLARDVPSTPERTPGSASSWRLRRFCPSSSEYHKLDEETHRSAISRHTEPSGSESSNLQSDYEKLLVEFSRVREQLQIMQAQEEVERNTPPLAKAPSSKPLSLVAEELRPNQQYSATESSPFTVNLGSTNAKSSPSAADEQKKDEVAAGEELSDISSQETDCFVDTFSSDQADSRKENGLPLITAAAASEISAAALVNAGDVKTAVADTGDLAADAEIKDGVAKAGSSAATSQAQVAEEEEEDLDELELRRLCLASAAARFNRMTADDDLNDMSSESVSLVKSLLLEKEPLAGAASPYGASTELSTKPASKSASQADSRGHSSMRQPSSRESRSHEVSRSQSTKVSPTTSRSRKSSGAKSDSNKQNSSASRNNSARSCARGSPHRQASSSKDRGTSRRTNPEKSVPARQERPLPFAPVRLEKIRLTHVSPKAGGLRDAARRAQMRARQTSVARQLPKSSAGSSHMSTSPSTGSEKRRMRESVNFRSHRASGEKREEAEKRREIQKILSLKDPKVQAERFLRLLSGSLADGTSPVKLQHLKDNYEQIEMDIDSSDEVADELGIDEFQSAMQPMRFMSAEPGAYGLMDRGLMHQDSLLLPGGQWLPPPPLLSPADPFPGFVSFLPAAPIRRLPPPPLPLRTPLLPPLPADDLPCLPHPPPPPPKQDMGGSYFGAGINGDQSLFGDTATSHGAYVFSTDVSSALSYLRRAAYDEHIPFVNDAESGGEQIPFIGDAEPHGEHASLFGDVTSGVKHAAFNGCAKPHIEHIPFIGDAETHSEHIPFMSDSKSAERYIPFIGDAKPADEHIPFISDARTSYRIMASDVDITVGQSDASVSEINTKSPHSVMSPYDADILASRHSQCESNFVQRDRSSPSVSVVTESDCKCSPVSAAATGPSAAESSPSQAIADDDDDNEEELRAQLLQSLLTKRREAESKQQQADSMESSPAVSVTASPQRLVVKKPRGVSREVSIQKSVSYSVFPIHKPVVVTLGGSSSEDEEEEEQQAMPQSIPFGSAGSGSLLGGFDIDSFLKAQRKTVEAQESVPPDQGMERPLATAAEQPRLNKLEQERQLHHQELELVKQRQEIVRGQSTLQQLLSKASKFLADMKKAESRATHLREQLHTAEKLILRYRHLVQTSKAQAKEMRDSLLKKKEQYQTAEISAMTIGRQLHGGNYKPRVTNLDVGVKRKVEVVNRDIEVSKALQPTAAKQKKLSKAENSQGSKENVPAVSISQQAMEARRKEKERLQKLAEEYEERIRQLKSLQAQKGGQAPTASHAGDAKPSQKAASLEKREKARLLSLETIKLEPVDGMQDFIGHPRRRSLLDITQSPKPNLLMKDQKKLNQESNLAAKDKQKTGADKTKMAEISFKMPTGSQLSNLCKIQKEKVDKVLSSHTVTCPEDFPHLELSCEPVDGLKLNLPGNRTANRDEGDASQHKLAYTSPLLHFRAYRFSPYYRTKENMTISSASFSHKLNPNRILCRYDLSGTCNDQHCAWQHARDYSLSDKEVLMDLVAYCPQLADATNDDPPDVIAKKIENFVDSLLSQNKGKMTADQLCLLLTSRVNECAKHTRPHTMFYESRPWRLSSKESSSISLSLTSQFQTPTDTISGVKRHPREMDAVLDVEDVRYFAHEADPSSRPDGADMEGAVLATPTDTDLWLRLAYSKLSNPARSGEECLNQALNILSRGLENNKNSQDLWVHYLALYRRHPDSSLDFEDLCRTAIHSAACYDIWWQLLEASHGFHTKDAVCTSALDFLCSEKESEEGSLSADVRSHQALEMLLYKVTLNSQSGRFKTALNFVQSVLGLREGRESNKLYLRLLTHTDTCVLWICLVHLMEFQTLPATLYSPASQNPGQIMSKEKLIIPWHSKRELATPLEKLAEHLGRAVTLDLTQPLDQCTSPQYVQAVQNLAELFRSRKKYCEACKVLQKVLNWAPHLEDVWLLAADIYAGCEDLDNAKKVLMDAVSSNEYSAKLHYHYALLEVSLECSDEALEHMEQFAISHFDSSMEDMTKVDPNMLYCKLLGLEIPVRKHLPRVKDELKDILLQKNAYVWLCYCLLLELQGETEEAVDVFELALSSTTQAAGLALLWKCYVQFLYRRCQSYPASAAPKMQQQLQEAMFRSITTLPTLVPIPFPRQHQTQQQLWCDQRHVTALVEFYVEMVPADTRTAALQTFCDLMPDNVHLLIRCVETALADEQLRRARSLCTAAVYDKMANLHLWKLALALAQMEGTPKEVESLYVRAVRSMPLSVSLWKDFLLYEVSQENPVAVQAILAQCQDLGLNIQGYVATISSSSTS